MSEWIWLWFSKWKIVCLKHMYIFQHIPLLTLQGYMTEMLLRKCCLLSRISILKGAPTHCTNPVPFGSTSWMQSTSLSFCSSLLLWWEWNQLNSLDNDILCYFINMPQYRISCCSVFMILTLNYNSRHFILLCSS